MDLDVVEHEDVGIFIDDRDEWDEHRVQYGYPQGDRRAPRDPHARPRAAGHRAGGAVRHADDGCLARASRRTHGRSTRPLDSSGDRARAQPRRPAQGSGARQRHVRRGRERLRPHQHRPEPRKRPPLARRDDAGGRPARGAAHPRPRRRNRRELDRARRQRSPDRRGRLLAGHDRRGPSPLPRHLESLLRRSGCHGPAVRRRRVRHRHDVVRAAQRQRAEEGARRAAAGDQARRTARGLRVLAPAVAGLQRPVPLLQRPDPPDGGQGGQLQRRGVRLSERVDQGLAGSADAQLVDPHGGLDGCRVPQPLVRHRRPPPRPQSPPGRL